jgi:hypothetical protein
MTATATQPAIFDTDVASLSHKGKLPDPLATRPMPTFRAKNDANLPS